MANYTYIDAQGKPQTVQASSSQEAITLAPNIASNSGVQLVTPPPTGAPQINPVIDTGLLTQNGTQPTLPPAPPPTDYAAYVAGLTPLSIAPVGAGVGAQEASVSTLTQRLAADNQKLLGEGAEQLRLEGEAGIPQSVKDINALTEQITSLKAQFDSKMAGVATNTFGVEAQDTRINAINRQSAVQIGGLSALLMAKQGSLDSARAEIDRVLALEFDPIRQDIENTKMFLDLNYQNLSRADQKQAQALQAQLQRESQANSFLESIKKSAYEQIISKGGTPDQITALSNAKTAEEVIAAFGTGIIAGATPNLASGQPDIVGQLASTINLSGKDVPQAAKALGVLSSVQKLATANQEGNFIGEGPNRSIFNLRSGDARTEFATNKADLAGIKSAVAIWVSGATLSEQQMRDVLQLVPNVNDTDFAIREKLNNLSYFMQNQAQAELAAKGVSFTPTKVDYFATPIDNYITTAVTEVTDPYQQYLQSIYGQ